MLRCGRGLVRLCMELPCEVMATTPTRGTRATELLRDWAKIGADGNIKNTIETIKIGNIWFSWLVSQNHAFNEAHATHLQRCVIYIAGVLGCSCCVGGALLWGVVAPLFATLVFWRLTRNEKSPVTNCQILNEGTRGLSP